MIEVERKYRVRAKDFPYIMATLLGRLFPAVPLVQEDRYLDTDDAGLTVRVREQKSQSEVVYLRTEKRKCEVGTNTNVEEEETITAAEFQRLVGERQARFLDVPLIVRKNRIEFYGEYNGRQVTICLDRVTGPNDIDLGCMIELETMVKETSEVEGAQESMRALAREVLPLSRRREKRGYKNMLRQVLKARAKKRAEEKKPAGAKKKPNKRAKK